MKILIAAGSSGGHIFPALATASKLKELDAAAEIFFVGSSKAIDKEIFKKAGYDFGALSADKRIFKDMLSSLSILKRVRPDIAVGFGGYCSFPALAMAKASGIPVFIHEQNVVPGLANRILAAAANRIAVSFAETNNFFFRRPVVKETGNPVRASLLKIDKVSAHRALGLDKDRFTVLVMGGSQGAHFINERFLEALRGMSEERKRSFQVIHLCGARDLEAMESGYAVSGIKNKVFAFFDRMNEAYCAADLAVSRAGATSIAELAFFGLAAVLIPYPNKKVHQRENAKFLEKNGAAVIIEQKDLTAQALRETIFELADDRARLRGMSENSLRLARPEAANNIALEILDAIKG